MVRRFQFINLKQLKNRFLLPFFLLCFIGYSASEYTGEIEGSLSIGKDEENSEN